MSNLKLFRNAAGELQQKYSQTFVNNSIHDHYYIYHDASGPTLRINATSELPNEIKQELTQAFQKVIEVRNSWLRQSGESRHST